MLPSHLSSTLELLKRTFPSGLSEPEYLPLLAILYPHLADGNLATVVAEFTGKDKGIVLNDVYAAGAAKNLNPYALASVRERLIQAGFEEWLTEV